MTLGTYKYCPLHLFDLRGSAKHIIKGSFVEKLRVRESEHSPAGDIDHAWNTLSKSFEEFLMQPCPYEKTSVKKRHVCRGIIDTPRKIIPFSC